MITISLGGVVPALLVWWRNRAALVVAYAWAHEEEPCAFKVRTRVGTRGGCCDVRTVRLICDARDGSHAPYEPRLYRDALAVAPFGPVMAWRDFVFLFPSVEHRDRAAAQHAMTLVVELERGRPLSRPVPMLKRRKSVDVPMRED